MFGLWMEKLNSNPQVTERNTRRPWHLSDYGLKEGVYKVSAGGHSLARVSAFDRDVPVYHPSQPASGASEVILHSGDEITNIDIRYVRTRSQYLRPRSFTRGYF